MFPPPLMFSAVCLAVERHHILVLDENAAGRGESFGPPVYVRFAFAPVIGHERLIPAKVVDDWGNEFFAPEVYDWIEARGGAFPRADVDGLTPDGQPRQRFMKELDLAASPLVFAARTAHEFPGLPISLVLRPDPTAAAGIPAPDSSPAPHPILARALPRCAINPADLEDRLIAVVARLLGEETKE